MLLCTFVLLSVIRTDICTDSEPTKMPTRTVFNDKYSGLVDTFHIQADIHRTEGRAYATHGDVIPIHCCDEKTIAERAPTTHHYCDIFTDQILAPLGDITYVRIDENTAEKVFVNRNKKMLIWSSDGRLAIWRCAPTFESNNQYMAGTPIVNKDGTLISVVTAKKGNNYAVSTFEGEGGYFETGGKWEIFETPVDKLIYGNKVFEKREELYAYVEGLPPVQESKGETIPVCHQSRVPRVCLVAANGRQISHNYLSTAITGVEYL